MQLLVATGTHSNVTGGSLGKAVDLGGSVAPYEKIEGEKSNCFVSTFPGTEPFLLAKINLSEMC